MVPQEESREAVAAESPAVMALRVGMAWSFRSKYKASETERLLCFSPQVLCHFEGVYLLEWTYKKMKCGARDGETNLLPRLGGSCSRDP